MEFELSSELINEIVFSMEDQTDLYCLDSEITLLVKKTEVTNPDPDRYYSLPVWDSISGFRLMEHFVVSLNNPIVREELRSILKSGHGVFRNFKNVLKAHPEFERMWFSFKEHEMNRVIHSWYDDLREVWGLVRIGEEPEENAELVHDDFTFRLMQPRDEDRIAAGIEAITEDLKDTYGYELGTALSVLWQQKLQFSCSEPGLVCETVFGDFAGYAAASVPDGMPSVVAVIHALIILPRYRGLGLGKELLQMCLEQLQKKGIHYVLFDSAVFPEFFKSFLEREGFQQAQAGSVLYLNFSDEQ